MKKLFKMMALVAFMASAGIVSAADSDKAAAKSSTMKVPKPASSVGGAGYAEAVITMPVPSENLTPNGLTSNQSAGSFCGQAIVMSRYGDESMSVYDQQVRTISLCQGHEVMVLDTTWDGTHRLAKADCPSDYISTLTGASGYQKYYSCLK